MSFQDTAFIFFIALLLFGPKKLPELARYVGKLMGEFRRASNEFRMQMEEELRLSEQAEQQKKIAAMEAAAPLATPIPEPEHPHLPPPLTESSEPSIASAVTSSEFTGPVADPQPLENTSDAPSAPLPIASSGELDMLPPSTGLPVARGIRSTQAVADAFDSIPHVPEPETSAHG